MRVSKASNSIYASWHPWRVREPLRVEMFIVLQDEHRSEPEITLYIPGFRRLQFGFHRKYASGEDGGLVLGCVGEMLHIWLTLVDNIIETIPKLSSAAGAAC